MLVVAPAATATSKPERYRELQQQLAGLFANETDGLANAANLSALLYAALPGLNWVGCYFLRESELVLGPFQGKVACVRIALGCGCAALRRKRDEPWCPDVHHSRTHRVRRRVAFGNRGAIAPSGQLLGVLDLDSPEPLASSRRRGRARGGGGALLASSDLSRLV